ncbi:hypothetical protein ACTFIZ_011483 [Dictyostelium cf. discoideum]
MVDLVTDENGKYTLNDQVPASYLCVKIIIPDHCKQVTQSQTRSPLTRYGITIYPDGNYQFKDAPSSDYCIEETTTIPDQYKPVNTSSSSSPSDSPFSLILDDSIIKSCFTVSGALDCQNLALSPFYEITTATTATTTTAITATTTATITATTATVTATITTTATTATTTGTTTITATATKAITTGTTTATITKTTSTTDYLTSQTLF